MPPQIGGGPVGGAPVGGGIGGLGPLSGQANGRSGAIGHLSQPSVVLGIDLIEFDLSITRRTEFNLTI
jgi:hypothetical protein